MQHRDKGLAKIKQLLVMEFHTVVVSKMENRLAAITTASKLATLLGLLGTVIGMIAAFGRMGDGQKADPSYLAGAISLALWTTAIGLIIASPLIIFANDLQARMRHLRDQTERQLSDYIEIAEQFEARDGRPHRPRPAPPPPAALCCRTDPDPRFGRSPLSWQVAFPMLLQRQLSADINSDLDLTSMVDVIFQLLTFLLMTYQPVPGEIDVPKAAPWLRCRAGLRRGPVHGPP